LDITADKQGQSDNNPDGTTYVPLGATLQVARIAGEYSAKSDGACLDIAAGKQGQILCSWLTSSGLRCCYG